jgi:hypothetical protein
MRSLAAAISPGYFGFTDWAFAAEAASEIAVQVPIATRKNNALIIVSSRIRLFSRLRSIRSASWAGLVQIKVIETSSDRILASIAASTRARQSAACRRYSLTARLAKGVHGFSDISLAYRGSIDNTFSVFVSFLLKILLTVC